MCMMCEPPFGLIDGPRLQALPPHWPPELAAEASNGENRPAGAIVGGCGSTVNWKRVPREPVGLPEMSRPASWLVALGAFQRACCRPKVWTNVGSRWLVVLKLSRTTLNVPERPANVQTCAGKL